MSHDTLTALPEVINAGTTVKFTRSLSEVRADQGWALTLYIVGPKTLTKAGVVSGSSFTFTLTSAETAALTAGNYQYAERATKSGETYDCNTIPELARGVVQVLADFATATDGSFQTWEEKQLSIVEAAISGRLTKDWDSFQIEGRAVSKIPMKELYEIRNSLIATIKASRAGGQFGQAVSVRFTK